MSGTVGRNSRGSAEEAVLSHLLSMRDEDLRVRGELAATGTLSDTFHARMEKVHLENASRLASILEEHGWPDPTLSPGLEITICGSGALAGDRLCDRSPGLIGVEETNADDEGTMAKIRQYDGDGIRVTYDAERCIHAAECVHGLPDVFDPNRKPWIEAGAASAEDLAAVIRRCPTGALAYERLDGGRAETKARANELRVIQDGPVYATGELVLLDAEHGEIGRETRVAFCRCGASENKPYCDGRHTEAGFEDPGVIGTPTIRPPGDEDSSSLTVRLRPDGPLVLEGRFTIVASDDGRAEGAAGALCRCGASKNKPFCDGTHREVGFEANDPTAA